MSHAIQGIRVIVFDVGETLIDESRLWAANALKAGVTPFVLMAQLGSLIERGLDHRRVWSELGVEPPSNREQITAGDFYADALPCLKKARSRGFAVGIAGNQPLGVVEQLSSLGCDADFIASSSSWGVAKPSPILFEKLVEEAGAPADEILYVGDRIDNDIEPAHRAGMRTALIVRGPWAHIHRDRCSARLADLHLESLKQLHAVLEKEKLN
ncbi:HAD family hydrolase [Brevibacterium oceani]|uniref:HAD family hydrolase n=1 Tax=Brevibacterium oceani TaxID=358099 RepID=UPI0015E6B52A|nr:HAD family hydrolase [Brevibacterium oceani]